MVASEHFALSKVAAWDTRGGYKNIHLEDLERSKEALENDYFDNHLEFFNKFKNTAMHCDITYPWVTGTKLSRVVLNSCSFKCSAS